MYIYGSTSVYVCDTYHYQQALSVPIPHKVLSQEPDQHQIIIFAKIFIKPLKCKIAMFLSLENLGLILNFQRSKGGGFNI